MKLKSFSELYNECYDEWNSFIGKILLGKDQKIIAEQAFQLWVKQYTLTSKQPIDDTNTR